MSSASDKQYPLGQTAELASPGAFALWKDIITMSAWLALPTMKDDLRVVYKHAITLRLVWALSQIEEELRLLDNPKQTITQQMRRTGKRLQLQYKQTILERFIKDCAALE